MVFVGCLNEEELGVKVLSLKRILDKYMMLLLYQSNGYQVFCGWIGLESKGLWVDGWCVLQSDLDFYI